LQWQVWLSDMNGRGEEVVYESIDSKCERF